MGNAPELTSQQSDAGLIYHMLAEATWLAQRESGQYAAESLLTQGFIHCSPGHNTLLLVANSFYFEEPGDWVVLVIREAAVQPEVRWEDADGMLFPHIYGALNLDAVSAVKPFPRTRDGRFVLPVEWQ